MRTVSKFLGFFLALSIFAFGSTAGALAQGEKRLAFVIGNAAYPAGALATPANDAGLIAQTLQAAGFDVVGARDVDQESLRGAYRDFLAKVTAAGPDAVVFVYLAGQGLQFEGENYFVPVDAQIANAADVPMAADAGFRSHQATGRTCRTRSTSSCSTRRGRIPSRSRTSRLPAASHWSTPTRTC